MAKAAQTYLTLGLKAIFRNRDTLYLKGGLLDESATQIRTAKGNR